MRVETELLAREKRLVHSDFQKASKSCANTVLLPERFLHQCNEVLLQSQDQHSRAIDTFELAIAIAREVHAPYEDVEAKYALSLFATDSSDDARRNCDPSQCHRRPATCRARQLCLALGNKERALHHVLKGYKKAWANGPPHIYHWDLEACRKVLRTLGTAEPVLPPFDPNSVKPFDFEPAIRALMRRRRPKKPRKTQNGRPKG